MTLTFHAYQENATNYPKGVNYPFLGLAGECDEVCELAKKVQRDKGGEWSEADIANLKKELGDVLWYLSAIATDHSIDLSDVAFANLDSRRMRGTLQGSGNDR
jgi:NTP pyrophosphatase (non-canonical NTP hydrolase)